MLTKIDEFIYIDLSLIVSFEAQFSQDTNMYSCSIQLKGIETAFYSNLTPLQAVAFTKAIDKYIGSEHGLNQSELDCVLVGN